MTRGQDGSVPEKTGYSVKAVVGRHVTSHVIARKDPGGPVSPHVSAPPGWPAVACCRSRQACWEPDGIGNERRDETLGSVKLNLAVVRVVNSLLARKGIRFFCHPGGISASSRGSSDSDNPRIASGKMSHPGRDASGLLRSLPGSHDFSLLDPGVVAFARPPATCFDPSGIVRLCFPAADCHNRRSRSTLATCPAL